MCPVSDATQSMIWKNILEKKSNLDEYHQYDIPWSSPDYTKELNLEDPPKPSTKAMEANIKTYHQHEQTKLSQLRKDKIQEMLSKQV